MMGMKVKGVEYRHVARECQKPKRAKDAAYHREKMLLCKQEEAGIQLNAEQADWKDDTNDESDEQELEAHYMYMAKLQQVSPDVVDSGSIFDTEPEQKVQNDDHYDVFAIEYTDEEIDEQELEAHYSYMAKIQEVPTADTGTDSEPLEQVQNDAGYNVFANDLQHSKQSESVSITCFVETDDINVIPDSPDMCDDDIQNDQNDVESDDECVALANLKFDVVENKKIQKQLKKANTTLAQELKECKTILTKTSKTLGESNSV
nr:hypothetical protein [Tanacetum cinerariifolium]